MKRESLAASLTSFVAAARALPRSAKLTAVAALLLLVAWLDPRVNVTRDAFDYVIVLDITQSMNTTDYQVDGKPVSRLQYAKFALQRVLRELPCGTRVGWAVFSEYRALLLFGPVEVCANFPDLSATLERIDGRMSWAGASEIAKGLFWSLRTARALPGNHGVVFFTDGHEAPPVHPAHRPQYDGKPGDVRGLIVGVGGDELMPIPKFDPDGQSLGFWAADEVAQVDVYSRGRAGSAGTEGLVDETGVVEERQRPSMTEHLSSLKEPYLELLARELNLGYHRLTRPDRLRAAMTAPGLARPMPAHAELRPVFALGALAFFCAAYLPPLARWRRLDTG
jgi:mxaL protein